MRAESEGSGATPISQYLQPLTMPSRFPSPGDTGSSRLAFDLATQMRPAADIASDYGMTSQELITRLKTDRQLQLQVSELKRIWNSPLSAAERVRLKTAVMVEDGLTDLWRLMTNSDTAPAVRVDIHRHLAKLADVEPKKDPIEQGSRFSVTINLPGAAEPMHVVAESAQQLEADE